MSKKRCFKQITVRRFESEQVAQVVAEITNDDLSRAAKYDQSTRTANGPPPIHIPTEPNETKENG